jgi:hypothetical protein
MCDIAVWDGDEFDTVAELQDVFDLYHSQLVQASGYVGTEISSDACLCQLDVAATLAPFGYTVTPDDYGFLHIGERHDDSNASNDEASETQTHHTTEKPKPESFRGHTGGG